MKGIPAKPESFPNTFYNPGLDKEMIDETGKHNDYEGAASHTEEHVAKQKRAAKIILKQFLKFLLISKLYKIHVIINKTKKKKIHDYQVQDFETYGVDDSMCSICGVQFIQPLSPSLPEAVGMSVGCYMPPDQTRAIKVKGKKLQDMEMSHSHAAEVSPSRNVITKKSHIATFHHIQGAQAFKMYTEIFNEKIIPNFSRFMNLKKIVGKVNNPTMIRLKVFDVGTLKTKQAALMKLITQTTNARQWTRVKELQDGIIEIEKELDRIEKIYQVALQEMQEQKQPHILVTERDEQSRPPSVRAQDLDEDQAHAPDLEDEAGHLLQVTEKFTKPKGRGRGRGNRK